MKNDIIIIGGGAAGLAAAIESSRYGARVSVIEKLPRVGKKILATGNGRCNLMNKNAVPETYYGDINFARFALKKYNVYENEKFFKSLGLLCMTEEEGRMYPLSGQANSVLDVLRLEALHLGVEFICDTQVTSIKKMKNGLFSVNDEFTAPAVIVCAGGKSAPSQGSDGSGYALLEKFGHKITPLRPALVQLSAESPLFKSLKGVRTPCRLTMVNDRGLCEKTEGELQFTEYGLSGIAAMQLARFYEKGLHSKIYADIIPSLSENELYTYLKDCRDKNKTLEAENFLTGIFQKRLGQAVLKESGISPLSINIGEIPDRKLREISHLCKKWEFTLTGTRGFQNAQVTAGGADTKTFNPETMESKLVSGLYAAGEILNVDGTCGGYNLQWAWASGRLAGKSAALKKKGN